MLPDIQRRVVNAKYVLERAARLQTEAGEMSLSISLLLMHDAVELVMLAVTDHLQLGKKPREFMAFWSDIKQAGHPAPPDSVPMEQLNKLRVNFKHYGTPPHAQTVRDLLLRARGFFENVLNTYCGVSYADASLIDLVPDQEVRSMLRDAQASFSAGAKPDALKILKIALHRLENPTGHRLPLLQSPPQPRLPSEMQRAGWGQYLDQLHTFLDASVLRTNAVMVGIDPMRYASLVRNTPTILWNSFGHPSQVILTSTYESVSESDFNDMVDFLIDYAVKLADM